MHNLWPYGDLLFLAGYGDAGTNAIVDISTPTSPQFVAGIPVGIHDVNVVDDVLYIAGGFDATYMYDVSTPSAPALLETFTTNVADTLWYQHNAYPIRDTGYVVVTEEIGFPSSGPGFIQGNVRIWDLNGVSPALVWTWQSDTAQSDPNISPHNAYVIGDFMYLSAYQDGFKVFDVSDPTDPVEVAFFDTFPETPTGFFEGLLGRGPLPGRRPDLPLRPTARLLPRHLQRGTQGHALRARARRQHHGADPRRLDLRCHRSTLLHERRRG